RFVEPEAIPPQRLHSLARPAQPEIIAAPQPASDLSPLMRQTDAEAAAKSRGCVTCHQNTGDMHQRATVRLGCIDCHGGDPNAVEKCQAHVPARFPEAWGSSAN